MSCFSATGGTEGIRRHPGAAGAGTGGDTYSVAADEQWAGKAHACVGQARAGRPFVISGSGDGLSEVPPIFNNNPKRLMNYMDQLMHREILHAE